MHRLRGEAATKTRPRGPAPCRRSPPVTAAALRSLPAGRERTRVDARLSPALPEIPSPPVVFVGVCGVRGCPENGIVGAKTGTSFPHRRAREPSPAAGPRRGGWTREGVLPCRGCAHRGWRPRARKPPSSPRTVQRAPLPSVNTSPSVVPPAALLRKAPRSLCLRSGSPQSAQRRGCPFPPCPRKVPLLGATGQPRPAGCLGPRSRRVLCREWDRHSRLPP